MVSIHITNLQALDGDGDQTVAVHVLIQSANGERDTRTYYILPEQYAALKLRRGEIGSDTVDALEEAAKLSEAIRKGLHLLSYGAQSVKVLEQKLRARGYDSEIAAAAVAHLGRLGLMEESGDAMRVAQSCRRKHWGMRRILSHLFQKGYPESVIRAVQAELEEEDFVPDCVELIRSRYHGAPEGREARQKMTAALMRYGYSLGEIRRAIDIVVQEDEDDE